MLAWRIYYAGGQTFDSSQGPPESAPGPGVLAIVQTDDAAGRVLVTGDYYLRHRGEWIGVDLPGMLDHLMARGILKCGRLETNAEFRRMLNLAMIDLDFPPKSARYPGEPHG